MADEPRMLSPREVALVIGAVPSFLRAELSSLPADVVNFHPGPSEWCVKEALGHIMEAEKRGFAGRIRTILSEDEPEFEAWDQTAVERARNDCARDLDELLNEFEQLRAESVELVTNLSMPDLVKGGTHPIVGYLKVNDLLHEWIYHDRNHIRQMLANVQSYVYPLMGNSQGFAGE